MPNIFDRLSAPPAEQLPPGVTEAEQLTAEQLLAHLATHYDLFVRSFGELAELMRTPTPVWSRPSDALVLSTVGVRTDSPQSVYAGLDKARVTLVNVSDTDTGPTIYLGAAASIQPTPSTGVVAMPPGASWTFDTRAALWAIADGTDGLLSLAIESWRFDPEPGHGR